MARPLKRLWQRAQRALADRKLAAFRPSRPHEFFVVSAVHNAGAWVDKCLASVAEQRWDAERLTHLIIDDASSDDTVERIGRWLERERPAHRIERIDNRENLGGCANYALGFRRAPPDSIVLQLDGDDWLSDPLVLPYLDMVYHDPEVWMTYNTWMFPDGTPSNNSAPLPRRVIEDNAFREHGWVSSHLHSFRAELFSHVRDESLVDPETGELWRSAVDQACYLPMLELSGLHARHLERVTYVYNFRPESVYYARRDDQVKSDQRIRKLPRYRPLSAL